MIDEQQPCMLEALNDEPGVLASVENFKYRFYRRESTGSDLESCLKLIRFEEL